MEETKNTFKAHIIPRSGTAASWELANPVLLKGEMGVESDTGRFKFGDGVTSWNELSYSDKEVRDLIELDTEDRLSYGIEFDTAVSSQTCTRIGNPALHRSLPIHNRMKGCLLDDDGEVVEYLNPSNWTGHTRDGSRGQVMVELPLHYRKFETDGTKRRVRISEYPLPGYHDVPKMYVSAYEAAIQRSTNKLCSVVNMDADYRGGPNDFVWDWGYQTLFGRPATGLTRTNARQFARNRKSGSTEWNILTYEILKEIYWLFVIEYATLDSQESFNGQKDSNGYAQGGLGAGVTNYSSDQWVSLNVYNPFVPCGHTDMFGNFSGELSYTVLNSGETTMEFMVPRYRGIENPFGHIYKWVDGINFRISPTEANKGDNLSKVFVCYDPAKFKDNNYDGYIYIGNAARNSGYIKEIIFGECGEIIPTVSGGSSTTYFCDYYGTSITKSEKLSAVLCGGCAMDNWYSGLAFIDSHVVPSEAFERYGSRLSFIPQN